MVDYNNNGIDDLLEQYADPWGYSRPRGWYGEWPISTPAPVSAPAPVSTPPVAATAPVTPPMDLTGLTPDQVAKIQAYMALLDNGYGFTDYVNPTGYTAGPPPAVTPAPAPASVTPTAPATPAPSRPVDPALAGWLDPWSYSKPRGWEYTGLPWPPKPTTTAPARTTGGSAPVAGVAYGGMPTGQSTPAPTSAPARGGTYGNNGNPELEQVGSNSFEARLAATDRANRVQSDAAQTYVPDTGGAPVDQGMAMLYAALGLNPDGSPRNTNGGGGAARVVLSPEQIQSLVDGLGSQTMMAQQGVGQAYDQANREMAQLMRQYSRAEKMNRAGAQGTLSAFGAPKSAYKVGDFGAPEMLAGARASLIGNKAAEMSNWSNQQALYKQLLKDMGG